MSTDIALCECVLGCTSCLKLKMLEGFLVLFYVYMLPVQIVLSFSLSVSSFVSMHENCVFHLRRKYRKRLCTIVLNALCVFVCIVAGIFVAE